MSFYQSHIFCCTNTREPGSKRGSCGEKGSEAIRAYMKAKAKEMGLEGTRVNSAGCLDRCELGACVVIYPQGTWYRCNSTQEADAILQAVQQGTTVPELELK